MMHDSIAIPACFSADQGHGYDPSAITRSGQSVFMSVYQTKIAGKCRLITVTWCKNLLLHGLSLSVQGLEGDEQCRCKVELKPWYFWRKQGSKHFVVDGRTVGVVWDLKAAKFYGETEPRSDYYVAIVCEEEVVLLVGDMKKDAYRRTGCRPALIEPMLVSRKEHVFGKRKFSSRVKLERFHDISIDCNSSNGDDDPGMEIRVDGRLAVQVKHLQWKFRGNESIHVSKTRVDVCWDVHDWLFGSGSRHGLFIFKPVSGSSVKSAELLIHGSESEGMNCDGSDPESEEECSAAGGSSGFCLFLYAWKIE